MGPQNSIARIWRAGQPIPPGSAPDAALSAYLCGAGSLESLARRLEVAARQRPAQAAGLRAALAAVLRILWGDPPPNEAEALPAA